MTDFEERRVKVEEARLELDRAFSVVTTALISFAAIIFSVVQYVDSSKRALPVSINLRQGYRVAGYEIRYEGSELLRAEEVRRRLDRFDAPGRAFHLVPVSNRTPNYLSVFVCP